jgi:hypothetical protein
MFSPSLIENGKLKMGKKEENVFNPNEFGMTVF